MTANDAARGLLADRQARRIVTRLDPAPATDADGVSIQRALADLVGASVPAGFKIGATGARMQVNLGLTTPIAGFMASPDVYKSGIELPFDAFQHVGVECEIAVRLGRDLPPGPCDLSGAADAIADVFAAIEVVENRYGPDLAAFGAPSLCADQMFHAAAVLGAPGAPPTAARAMKDLTGRIAMDGIDRDGGLGSELLGDPLACLAWLAGSEVARAFGGLRAGQVVLLGSVTPPVWLDRPARVTVAFAGLPAVSLRLA